MSPPIPKNPDLSRLSPFLFLTSFQIGLTAWGLVRMQVNPTYKVVLGVAWLYLISSAFTLAKMLRDRQEADALHAQLHARPNHELLAHSHSAASTAAAQQA